jgi:hypothetical protein
MLANTISPFSKKTLNACRRLWVWNGWEKPRHRPR